MILLRIVSKSESKIDEIAELLLREKLVIDVNIKRHFDSAELVNDRLIFTPVYLLTAKTRATLFDAVDQMLNEFYPNHMPELYAIPIMQMDWKQADNLTKDVKSVSRRSRLKKLLNRIRGSSTK